MRKSRRSIATVVAAATATMVGAAGLALAPTGVHAQQAHVDDPPGDSTSDAVDITRLKVHHGRHRITATATMPELVPRRLSGAELLIRPRGRNKVYAVVVLRDRQGRVVHQQLEWRPMNDPIEPQVLPCSGIRSSIDGDRAVVSVPKRCLTKTPQDRPVRAKFRTTDGTQDLIGGSYFNDQTGFTRLLRPARAHATTGTTGRVTADDGLLVRGLPTQFSGRRGSLRDGSVVGLNCRVTGSVVRREGDQPGALSSIWYRLSDRPHGWVSSRYVRTPHGRPPYCGTGDTDKGRVTTWRLVAREAPTTRARSQGVLPRGEELDILCKLHGQRVGGNDLWYNLPLGLWVSASYVANIGAAPGWCTR